MRASSNNETSKKKSSQHKQSQPREVTIEFLNHSSTQSSAKEKPLPKLNNQRLPSRSQRPLQGQDFQQNPSNPQPSEPSNRKLINSVPSGFFSRCFRWLSPCKLYLSGILIVIFLGWSILGQSSKYYNPDHPCPRFATCNIFIQCHEGYSFDPQKKECQVDKSYEQTAEDRLKDTIRRLEYQFGDMELEQFWNSSYVFDEYTSSRPNVSVSLLLGQCSSKAQENILRVMIRDSHIQRRCGFRLSSKNEIEPITRKKSLLTRSLLTLKNNVFFFIQILVLLTIFFSVLKLFYQRFFSRQRMIYNFLQGQTKKYGEVDVKYYSSHVRMKFNKNEPIPSKLWQQVEKIRQKGEHVEEYESLTSVMWRYRK